MPTTIRLPIPDIAEYSRNILAGERVRSVDDVNAAERRRREEAGYHPRAHRRARENPDGPPHADGPSPLLRKRSVGAVRAAEP